MNIAIYGANLSRAFSLSSEILSYLSPLYGRNLFACEKSKSMALTRDVGNSSKRYTTSKRPCAPSKTSNGIQNFKGFLLIFST